MGGRPFRFVYFGGGTPSFLSEKQLTPARRPPAGEHPLGQGRGSHLRVRARHAQRAEGPRAARAGRHAAEPGRRALRRRDPARERPGPRVGRRSTAPGRGSRPPAFPTSTSTSSPAWSARLTTSGARPSAGRSSWSPTASRSTRWSCRSTRSTRRTSWATTIETPVADWPTKRAWVDYAFDEFAAAGYAVSSAYTMVRHPERVNFSYRDNLWRGSDLLGHRRRQLRPHLGRALPEPRRVGAVLRRRWKPAELPLQPGAADHAAAGADPRDDPAAQEGLPRRRLLPPTSSASTSSTSGATCGTSTSTTATLTIDGDRIELTRAGLLRVDALLPAFFEPEFRDVRYT